MLAALFVIIFAVTVLILILLAIVVAAIRQEPRDAEMRKVAPSLTAVVVRRLLGVYLRRPTPLVHNIDSPPDAWPTAGWTKPTLLPPGERR
jgi:hypothetical protein